MIKLVHSHDPDLSITLAPPAGEAHVDAFAAWFDARGDNREYFANMELVRAYAIEPRGEELSTLFRVWSGLPMEAYKACVEFATGDAVDHTFIDPRTLLDGSPESEVHLAAMSKEGVERGHIERLIRGYPRKGPPGQAQFVIAKFPWGYYGCRAPEPTEWFTIQGAMGRREFYDMARQWVQACTLFPTVPELLTRNMATPALVTNLGAMIRQAAGEGLVKRVGESSGA